MVRCLQVLLCAFLAVWLTQTAMADEFWTEPKEKKDQRMEWWREARFGMFIHWGLYSIPAGEWNDGQNHAEWIRTTAQIPLETYDQFAKQFDPTAFDADAWVKMAKDAGMRYVVITSKHHDGFCLWPSELTDFDVASTPFQRDILGELKTACDRHEIEFGLYHSIMDWHHPDYLPRRGWEKDRTADGAEYDRYVTYMKGQLKELVERYDPSVLWFDGEWETTWDHEMGKDLYEYVRGLKPSIIVNNRVDKGRQGMAGQTAEGDFRGDFGTPEQEIPAKGLPGVDWESCITMNDHWGYNQHDKHFKTDKDLVQKLIDISSKGGNFLLNVGPKSDGTFPVESIGLLSQMGDWMDVNGESIYATTASPFGKVAFGRVTHREQEHRLYLHVFEWPADGKLDLAGMNSPVEKVWLLESQDEVEFSIPQEGLLRMQVPKNAPHSIATVLVVQYAGTIEATLNARSPEVSSED